MPSLLPLVDWTKVISFMFSTSRWCRGIIVSSFGIQNKGVWSKCQRKGERETTNNQAVFVSCNKSAARLLLPNPQCCKWMMVVVVEHLVRAQAAKKKL